MLSYFAKLSPRSSACLHPPALCHVQVLHNIVVLRSSLSLSLSLCFSLVLICPPFQFQRVTTDPKRAAKQRRAFSGSFLEATKTSGQGYTWTHLKIRYTCSGSSHCKGPCGGRTRAVGHKPVFLLVVIFTRDLSKPHCTLEIVQAQFEAMTDWRIMTRDVAAGTQRRGHRTCRESPCEHAIA